MKGVAWVLKTWLGTRNAGIAPTCARAFTVSCADVAIGMDLRALAAHVLHHATQV